MAYKGLSRDRDQRMNFRCSKEFKGLLEAIHEKKKQERKSGYGWGKYSDADILDDAIHLLAEARGIKLH